jgi:hypothetical protein
MVPCNLEVKMEIEEIITHTNKAGDDDARDHIMEREE